MIPIQGFEGQSVAVLGMGRSGLAAARALVAGGAVPVCWDDNTESRARAEAEGFAIRELIRPGAFDDITRLMVSPGIPHLYPAPNPVIAAAWAAGGRTNGGQAQGYPSEAPSRPSVFFSAVGGGALEKAQRVR